MDLKSEETVKRGDGKERLTQEELLIEVLSRLPVKSVLRCKAVSKTWLSLISSPFFVKSHLHRAITVAATDDHDETLIGNLDPEFKVRAGLSFSLFQFNSLETLTNFKFPYSKGEYPSHPFSVIVGSLCGIVCIRVYFSQLLPDRHHVYLWNPATKQSKLIPPHTIQHTVYKPNGYKIEVALGFGFDPIDFDFKVVRVVGVVPPRCEVYSANRATWRKIKLPNLTDTPYKACFNLCLRGFLFTKGYNGMMAFDLNKEVFVCDINLPVICDNLCHSSNDYRLFFGSSIIDFKDSIAVARCSNEFEFQLWTLDDEACFRSSGGVKALWTIMLSVNVGLQLERFVGLFNSVEFLLVSEDDQWFLYNSDKKVGKYVNVYSFLKTGCFRKYTESLHSIAGSKLVKWSDSEDDSETDSEESNVGSEVGNEQNNFHSEDDNEEGNTDSGDK